jgi:2-iminobutanoate/2-iminopropanoate deaminase
MVNEKIAYPSVIDGLPYSGAVRAGDFVLVGGILGQEKATGELVKGGIVPETRRAFSLISEMLEGADASVNDVVKCTVLLSDIDYFPEMNSVFREVFPEDPPTRSTIIVPEIPKEAAIEVECTAFAPR